MSSSGDLAQTLKAGGMVPVAAKLAKGEAVDRVVARAFQHAVLPGRTIIRLTAEGVAAGDDLEMAVLGFGTGETRGVVGVERRRPLGFPGWALVHDPKNARYALDVVKEFKKLARKAKSKPGAAKEGIDAIAGKLGKSVPQFLPSFFEEAGRVFIEHGSPSYAAAMFGKAREAEAVHALEVDEQHRVDGFLEFALAGAVTTKALTQYAKDLGEGREPAVAYRHFRQLCVQRTLGGMPPWSGMAKELARLAKLAKLDPAVEAAGLVVEIIDSPALAKAASEFWRAYQAPLAELGKASPAARGVLLNLFPTGTTYNADLDEVWLELLEATGATEALVADSAPPEARTSAGRAAWFDRLTAHLARGRNAANGPRTFALLRRMAPKLIADGGEISCLGRWHQIDLDLVELALELGVPVRRATEHARFDLDGWSKRIAESDHGRDPVRTAAHPVLGPVLVEAVARSIGGEVFDQASLGKQGFLAAKRAWVEGHLDRAERGAMLALEEVLAVIATKIKAATFADLPDLHARLIAIEPARSLARSLRIGLVDELGWPALEEAAAELDPDGTLAPSLHGGLPAVVLCGKTRAIAIGPRGRLGVHDLVIPPRHELLTARFIGGQFLVVLKESYSNVRGYWSSAPHDVFVSETSAWAISTVANRVAVLADGAWVESIEPIRPGDRKVPLAARLAASDGTTCWFAETKDGQLKLREVSATGELGRFSRPSFLEAATTGDDDRVLDGGASFILPAPDGLTSSPLGMVDGVLGVRIRVPKPGQPGTRVVERIDGVTWTGTIGCVELVDLPGGGAPRPVVEETAWRETTIATLHDPEGVMRGSKIGGKYPWYWRGSVAAYPPALWHAMTPRDEAGSTRLHAVTDAEARALITLTPLAKVTAAAETAVVAGVATVLPEVRHPRLRAGIAGLVVHAAQLGAERDRLARERSPAQAPTPAAKGPDDATLVAGLGDWIDRSWRADGHATRQIAMFAQLCRSADRSDRAETPAPVATLDWSHLAVTPAALAFLATAIGTPADKRVPLAELLGVCAELPPIGKLRVFTALGALAIEGAPDLEPYLCDLRWYAGNAYAIRKPSQSSTAFHILEYAPDGVFKALPGLTSSHERRGVHGVSPDEAKAVLVAATAGSTSWSEAAAARLAAATGLTRSEATLLWAGGPREVDKELRDELELKASQVTLARDGLATVPITLRYAVIEETGHAGVAAVLAGSAVETMAAAWNRIVGARVAIPEELIAEADREVQAPIAPSLALAMIAGAAQAPRLVQDGIWALDAKGDIIRASKPEPLAGQTALADASPVFAADALHTVIAYVPFLYAELPVGHPVRALARVAHELVLARLRNPTLLVDAGQEYLPDEARPELDKMMDALGGVAITGLGEGFTGRAVRGAVIVRTTNYWKLRLRPAELDAEATALVGKLGSRIRQWGFAAWQSLAYARSAELAAMVSRIDETPVPAGGWEQNPLASAAPIVGKAANQLGVTKDAGALYLQFLALLWPTPKLLMMWNGWTAKQLDAATAELVDHELVIEAKRERAGRGHFLPGGWEALKSPHPPMETWKLPLYGTRDVDGDAAPHFPRFFAMAPFHQLFERAWKRIEADDVPRYDEVKR